VNRVSNDYALQLLRAHRQHLFVSAKTSILIAPAMVSIGFHRMLKKLLHFCKYLMDNCEIKINTYNFLLVDFRCSHFGGNNFSGDLRSKTFENLERLVFLWVIINYKSLLYMSVQTILITQFTLLHFWFQRSVE